MNATAQTNVFEHARNEINARRERFGFGSFSSNRRTEQRARKQLSDAAEALSALLDNDTGRTRQRVRTTLGGLWSDLSDCHSMSEAVDLALALVAKK